MPWLKGFAIWFVILLLAILNGGLREALLIPAFGKPPALLLSGMLLALFILVVSFVLVPRIGLKRPLQAVYLGLLWLGLTVALEFGFGHWVQGQGWSELLEAYVFRDGNLWPLVLVVTACAPWLAMRRIWKSGSDRSFD